MKRRSKLSSEPVKARRTKVSKSKLVLKPNKTSGPAAPAAKEAGEISRLNRELKEALERQTATSEVLKVISNSLGDLEPVFAAMLESATRLCDASFGSMQLRDGEGFRRVAMHNAPAEFLDFHRKAPVINIAQAKALADIIKTKQVVQVSDLQVDNPEAPIAKYARFRRLR